MSKIYDVLYVTADGQHRKLEIGAFNAQGAINATLELNKDAVRVLQAKLQDEWR